MDETNFTTLTDGMRLLAEKYKEREAFIFFDRNGRHSVCRPDEMYLLAGRFASRLRNRGFQPGDVICNALPNSLERLVTDFGILLAGCVGVNCQVVQKDGGDLWNMARLSECVAVIMPKREDNPTYRLLKRYLPSEIDKSGFMKMSISDAPTISTVIVIDRYPPTDAADKELPSLLTDLKASGEEVFSHECVSSDLAYIFQTSGSTGYSKLIPRTHNDILLVSRSFLTPEDNSAEAYFSDRPFGWTGGYPFHYFIKATVTVAQDYFDGNQTQNAKELWREISREQCSKAFFLPKDLLELINEFKPEPPAFQMKLIISGGQPVTKAVTEALGLLTKFMVITYASSEASAITNLFLSDKSHFQDFLAGAPFADTRIRVVDELMNDMEPGKRGKILLKSSRLFRHYYKEEHATRGFTSDGWYISGDKGWMDEEGLLYVVDRYDNIIHNGSILVYPSWLEGILSDHSKIKDVAIIGIPNDTGDSDICACLVKRPNTSVSKDDILKFYEDSLIRLDRQEYVPSLTFIEFLDDIPKTFNFKVDRRRLRDLIFSRLGVNVK